MDEKPDQQTLRELAQALIGSWYSEASRDGTITMGQRGERPDERRFVSIFALAGHTHMLIDQALQHLDKRQLLLAMPLLRLAYESALTSAWMAQNNESADALYNREIGAIEAIKVTVGKSRQFGSRLAEFPELADKIADVSSDRQAKYFQQLCEDFAPDGQALYLLYRILSKYCHPSGFVIDRFLRTDDEGGVAALGHLPLPDSEDLRLWYFVATLCLVYAGQAVNYIEPTRTRRGELRSVARRIGIPPDLELTQEARQRIAGADQVRRRAAWRGPRRKTRRPS